ncbi:MAG: DUF2924 domain-containing protein [Mesorhizobium sp.]
MRTKPDVQAEVAALTQLSRDQLIERWTKIYSLPPPKGIRQELMVRAVAWHLQARRLGGYSAETRRLLRSAIDKVERELIARNKQRDTSPDHTDKDDLASSTRPDPTISNNAAKAPRQRRKLSPGARLLREWGGRTHIVDVIEGGYVFEAKVYPSLTAIADKITGRHQSGPGFFGL